MKRKRRKKNKEGGQQEKEAGTTAVFDRIHQPTRAESLGKLGRDGNFLTLTKVTHKNTGLLIISSCLTVTD